MTARDRDDDLERAATILGARARRHVALGPLTTYKVGGPAALFVSVSGDDDLAAVAEAGGASGLPILVVGLGSNLLVADAGFRGIALTLGPAYETVVIDGTLVRAGGAASLPVVARRAAAAGLTGLEWAVGVPGSVGGAVRMNAGGHGSDMASTVETYRVLDLRGAAGESGEFGVARLAYAYRRSSIGPAQVVVGATLRAREGSREAAEAEIVEIVRWRREHQPGGHNAGSVFTNPPGDAAGRLVDLAGLKGRRWGTAVVSDKHANFVQVEDGGSADDVAALIRDVGDEVERRLGIRLATEIRLIGFPGAYPQAMDADLPRAEA
jgi:UDP-N-acetylmuramate dehydrogenase